MKSFNMEIGGIPISIESKETSFVELIAEKYKAFTTTTSSPLSLPLKLYMNTRHAKDEKRKKMLDEELWIDVTYRFDRFFVRRPDLVGEINLIKRKASVSNRAALYSFDSFLRILYSLALIQESGFLLHAASVVRNGVGYVFMGPSGAGKSAVASYSLEYTVLSDEISLIKRVGDHYMLYSTPFWGEQEIKGGNFCAPIKGIYLLKQSPHVSCKELSENDSFRHLMKNILYFAREPFLTRQLFQNCYHFIGKIRNFELSFKKNREFWNVMH